MTNMKYIIGSRATRFASFVLILLVSLSAQTSVLQDHTQTQRTNWRNRVSYDEFTYLLQTKVSQMSELQELWAYQMERPELLSKTFFAGGALRSLIKWTTLQLETRSFAEVYKLQPPTVDQLILEGADRDIFLISKDKETAIPKSYLEKIDKAEKWDVLDQGFLRDSQLAGGSGIEKIGVNPKHIHDPYGALKDYYQRKMPFHNAKEEVFSQFRPSPNPTRLQGNSKIALVMRHLRFVIQFGDVDVSREEILALTEIVKAEAGFVKKKNYWILKSLEKLDKQCRKSGVDMQALLGEFAIDQTLAPHEYKLGEKTLKDVFAENLLKQKKFDFERINAYKNQSEVIKSTVDLVVALISRAKTPTEFMRLLEPGFSNFSKDYKLALERIWLENLDVFFAMNPSVEEIEAAKQSFIDNEVKLALMRKASNRVTSAADFIRVLHPQLKAQNDAFEEAVDAIWIENAERFARLAPTFNEIFQAKEQVSTVEAMGAIIEANIRNLRSLDEFNLLLKVNVHRPTPALYQMMQMLRRQHTNHFNLKLQCAGAFG